MSAVTALAGRNLRRLSRQPENVVASLAFPVLLMLLLLAVFGTVVSDATGGGYIDQLLPLIVLEGAAFGAVSAGIGLRVDLEGGLVARLRTMPVAPLSLVASRALSDAARVLAVAVVLTVVGLAVGFRFTTGPLGVVGFFALAVVASTGFTWLALAAGMATRTPEAVSSVLAPLFLLMLFFCSAFVPVEAFPGAVQPLVRANPFSCAANALTGLARGGPTLVPILQTLAWTAALVAVSGWVVLRRWARITR